MFVLCINHYHYFFHFPYLVNRRGRLSDALFAAAGERVRINAVADYAAHPD